MIKADWFERETERGGGDSGWTGGGRRSTHRGVRG